MLFATGEDSFEDTLKPRLIAAGADLDRIVFLDAVAVEGEEESVTGSFHLPKDSQLLYDVEEARPVLLIVDPLSAHLSSGVDSWKDESIRQAMTPLTNVAQNYGCAVVIAHHTNKRSDAAAIVRVGGSLGGGRRTRSAASSSVAYRLARASPSQLRARASFRAWDTSHAR